MSNDLISRSALLKRLEMISKNCKANKAISKDIGKQIFDIAEKTVKGCIMAAKNAPAVDAVEVVRCKDCAVPHNKWTGCPNLNGLVPHPNHFCSYGERKEDGI